MSRWLLLALLVTVTPASAQDASFREDLRFAEALRNRGDADLALEHLKRMEKGASAALKQELSLEFAKTRLRLASDEPDTRKRLLLYKQAQNDFAAFIKENPGHPRIAEANLDIARVLNATGKTELSQALLNPEPAEKKALAAKARATLALANTRLQAAEKALVAYRATLPEPDKVPADKQKQARLALKRADNDIERTQFERGMNLFDQSETYLGGSGDAAAGALLESALGVLDPLAGGPARSPVTWKAKAWQGRIIFQTETAEKARAKLAEVLDSRSLAAAEGQRLASYFRMLAIRDKPQPEDTKWKGTTGTGVTARLRANGEAWRRNYSPRYSRTPEGYGVAYLLAQVYLGEADGKKRITPAQRDKLRNGAKVLLRELESTENEYSDRARRLKIGAMVAQGAFKRKISELKKFEDLYIRSQYEAFQITSAKDQEAERKIRVPAIREALRRALAAPDLKNLKNSSEPSSARAMLAFWAVQAGMQAKPGEGDADLEEAAKVGEELIRTDPRSPQAPTTAIYALQAVSALLDRKRAKFDDGVTAMRERLNGLAAYVEDRWPVEPAGLFARHTIALQLLRDENYPSAIKKLEMIPPTYGNYAVVCFQIADAAERAAKNGIEPITGDRPGDYKKRALLALERIPLSGLGGDPSINRFTVAGKARLAREMFRFGRFARMKAIADELLPKLDGLKFNENGEVDKAVRNQMRYELTDAGLFASYGLATAAFSANDYKKAASLLDPLVDTLSKKGVESPEKTNLQKNQQLATAILVVALKANLQLGLIDRTDLVLRSLDEVNGGGGGASILQMLASLIRIQVDEIRKKGDAPALTKAVKSYSELLQRRTKGQKRTPELIRALAGCYSSMGNHVSAAKELGELAEKPGNEKDSAFLGLRLAYIRELRLSKEPANLKKARTFIDEAMGDSKKAGWGRRNLTALKENGYLLQEEGKYAEGFALWVPLVKELAKKAQEGGPMREAFLETYYNMVYCLFKMGVSEADSAKREKAVAQVAQKILTFEDGWESFGGGASEKRFRGLLAQEEALRKKYEELKKAKGKK